jgi:four helix bundle protein
MSSFPQTFPHHRLDAYRVALEAMVGVNALSRRVPRGHRSVADQMKRSSRGVGEKRQRFTEARGEAGETAAWLEILVVLDLADEAEVAPTAHLLSRVAAMLTRLIQRCR